MRSSGILCAVLALLTMGWTIAQVMMGTEYLATQVAVDDTFYYLQIARNHIAHGYPTFDGSSPTNGFHPLWYGLVLVIAVFFEDKDALLAATITVSGLLTAGCFGFTYAIGKHYRNEVVTVVAAGLWFAYALSVKALGSGMEACATAFLFWWCCLTFVRANDDPDIHPMALVAPAVPLLWCRIDTAPFLVAMLVYLAYRHRTWKPFAVAAVLVAIDLVPYVWLMREWNGTSLPIAGLIKSDPADSLGEFGTRLVDRVYRVGLLTLPGKFAMIGLAAVGFASLVSNRRRLPMVWVPLLAGGVAYLVLVAYSQTKVQKWYFVPFDVALILGAALVLSTWRKVGYAAVAVFVLIGVATAGRRAAAPRDPMALSVARYRLAKWMDAHLPPHVVLASWNAGQIGYFSNRRTVNLDGLVNSKAYSERILRGNGSLKEWLKERDVSYVVDYVDPGRYPLLSELPIVKSVPVRRRLDVVELRIYGASW